MPEPSFLDGLEKAFEHALTSFEKIIAYPAAMLERYAARMYRFLRHTLVQGVRFVWLIVVVVLYFLAPSFVFAFGCELALMGINWLVKGIGILIGLVGLLLLIFMLMGLVTYFFKQTTAGADDPGRPQRKRLGVVALFDATAIFLLYAAQWYLPGYVFAFPPLAWASAFLRSLSK